VHSAFKYQLLVTLSVTALVFSGCASYRPTQPTYQPQLQRALVDQAGPIRASVAVLSDKEVKTMFDLPLRKMDIQPVWVRIENSSTNRYIFLPATLDSDYYSPIEVAYKNRKWCSPKRNRRVIAHLESRGIKLEVPPEGVTEGFVFANYDPGAKHVLIEILGEEEHHRLEFHVPVPGKRFDFQRVDFENLYAEEHVEDYSLEELRAVLESLPATTTDKKGTQGGDPVNLVIVADENNRISLSFARQGWDLTEALSFGEAFKLVSSFIFSSSWRTSPVSSLYLFGRPQDFAMQKARRTIHERNHLRLWLAPFTCEGRNVFVDQISRDIGLRFSTRAPGFVTHKIDPNTDEARDYLTQEMLSSGSVYRLAYVRGVGKINRENPQRNLTGDPYYTDGNRAVFFLRARPVAPAEVHFLLWHRLPEIKTE
jgi:hypothetical protein